MTTAKCRCPGRHPVRTRERTWLSGEQGGTAGPSLSHPQEGPPAASCTVRVPPAGEPYKGGEPRCRHATPSQGEIQPVFQPGPEGIASAAPLGRATSREPPRTEESGLQGEGSHSRASHSREACIISQTLRCDCQRKTKEENKSRGWKQIRRYTRTNGPSAPRRPSTSRMGSCHGNGQTPHPKENVRRGCTVGAAETNSPSPAKSARKQKASPPHRPPLPASRWRAEGVSSTK